MLKRKNSSVISLALLASLGALAPATVTTVYLTSDAGIAQSPAPSPAFPLPSAVPSGSAVRVDASPSMTVVSQFLKQRYEKTYPGTQVNLSTSSSDAAVQALVAGSVDLAAIGRPLTPAEKAQGLVPETVGREKIAIIVGPKNPYKGDITFDQFARIFRGEITDWSELGGPPGRIRFIDRPDTSDTRQAFRAYPVFQAAPFENGDTTVKADQDDTSEVIKQLGTDGISYAVYSQVKNIENARIIPMHKTLPDDPRYPFSQPRYYIYKQNPAAGTAAFLGFVAAAPGQAAIAEANAFEAAAIAAAAASATNPAASPEVSPVPAAGSPAAISPAPDAVAQVPTPDPAAVTAAGTGDQWTRWLLLLPVALVGLAWWLSRRRRGASPSVVVPPSEPLAIPSSSAPATTPVPPVVDSPAASASLLSPPTPPTPPIAPALETPPSPQPPSPPPIPEPPSINSVLGAGAALATGATGAAIWSNLADDPSQSNVEASKFDVGQDDRVGVPKVRGDSRLAGVDEGLNDLPTGYGESRIVLMPRDPQWAYAYWDASNEHKAALRQQGGSRLALRFYDVTDVNVAAQKPHSLQQYEIEEIAQDWYIPVPLSDRDYLVEIGYATHDGRWLMLARSAPIRIPPVYPTDLSNEQFISIDWGEPLQGKSFAGLDPVSRSASLHERMFELAQPSDHLAGSVFGSMQAVSSHAFASGVGMSGVGMSGVGISSMGMSGVGMSGVGMSGVGMSGVGISGVGMSGVGMSGVGMSGVGISSMGMSGVGISGVGMSGVGMSGIGLGVPTMSGYGITAGMGMSGVGMSGVGMSGVGMSGVGMELYTLSGYGMGSGVGMSGVGMSGIGMSGVGLGVPTMSGIGMSGIGMSGIGMSGVSMSGVGMSGVGMGVPTMSGIGMSGIGMSGIGFFASMPPVRSRKFWLVADAELIVYGATEPDASVTIAGQPVKLNPDGTFRFHMSFPNGLIDFPIFAVAADGVQSRSVHLTFNRDTPSQNTNTKEEAQDEPMP